MSARARRGGLRTRVDLGLFDLGFSWVEIGSVTPKPQVSPRLRAVPFSTFHGRPECSRSRCCWCGRRARRVASGERRA